MDNTTMLKCFRLVVSDHNFLVLAHQLDSNKLHIQCCSVTDLHTSGMFFYNLPDINGLIQIFNLDSLLTYLSFFILTTKGLGQSVE